MDSNNAIAWLTLATLITSIIFNILTWSDQSSQREMRDRLNFPRIAIKETNFFIFRSVSFDDFHNRDWGFIQSVIQEPDEISFNPNNAPIKNMIVAFDSSTGKYVENTWSISIPEIKSELTRRNIFRESGYRFDKMYKPIVTIQNTGQLPCIVDSIEIKNFQLDPKNYNNSSDYKIVKVPHEHFTLDPGQVFSTARISFNIPLNAPLPIFDFDYEIYFSSLNGKNPGSRKVHIKWDGDFGIRNND